MSKLYTWAVLPPAVRDQADPGEDLIPLDDNVIAAVDPLYPRRTISEGRIDAALPQIGRFEHVKVEECIGSRIGISILS